MNRDGFVLLPILAVFTLVAVGMFLYNLATATDPHVDYTGQTTEIILSSLERQQAGFNYLDQTMRLAAREAAREQMENHGFASESQVESNCTELIHPVITGGCAWNKTEDFKAIYESKMRQREADNPYVPSNAYDLQHAARFDNGLRVTSQSRSEINIGLRSQPSPQQVDSTPFGDKIVSLQDLSNIQCPQTRSCTGLERPCAVRPQVYNALKSIDEYISSHNLNVVGYISQTTRSWEMQNRLHRAEKRYDRFMNNCDKSQTVCSNEYASYLAQMEGDVCRIVEACDPGNPDNPNRGCMHMRGLAVDISFTLKTPNGDISLNDNPTYKESLQKTLCDRFNLEKTYSSPVHYVLQENGCTSNIQAPELHQKI